MPARAPLRGTPAIPVPRASGPRGAQPEDACGETPEPAGRPRAAEALLAHGRLVLELQRWQHLTHDPRQQRVGERRVAGQDRSVQIGPDDGAGEDSVTVISGA